MHDRHSEKPVLRNDQHSDGYFHSVQLFRQRLTEIDEVSSAPFLLANSTDSGAM